jgi:hypothetical protein
MFATSTDLTQCEFGVGPGLHMHGPYGCASPTSHPTSQARNKEWGLCLRDYSWGGINSWGSSWPSASPRSFTAGKGLVVGSDGQCLSTLSGRIRFSWYVARWKLHAGCLVTDKCDVCRACTWDLCPAAPSQQSIRQTTYFFSMSRQKLRS